jgi:uncharacterized protein YjdB
MYGMVSKSKWRMAVQLLMAGTMIGCGVDQGTGPNPGPVPVASVRVEPKEGVWTGALSVGQTVELRARPLAADGNELPAGPIVWSSSDTAVASVNTAGVVKGLTEGSVEVSAKTGGKTGRVLVTVTADPAPPAAVALVSVSPNASVMEVGETRAFTVRVFDANQNELLGRSVSWSTTTPTRIEVGPTGVARAKAAGYAEIVATVEGKTGTASVTIPTPEPPPAPVRFVIVQPGLTSVLVKQHVQLNAVTLGGSGGVLSGRKVTWTSENPSIAEVDSLGAVEGITKGKVRIRATSEGVVGYATVEVREIPAQPIQSYHLAGTESSRTPYIEIGTGKWTAPDGKVYDVYYVVRGGLLELNYDLSRYRQSFTVEIRLAGTGPDDVPANIQAITDAGSLLYDFETGRPILKSDTYPRSEYRAEAAGAGEYVIAQPVMGQPSQRWLWVID